MLFTKFAKGQHGRSILEQLHSDENMKIKHIHLRFFIRLDLSIGCHHYYGGSRSRESFQLSSDGQPDMSHEKQPASVPIEIVLEDASPLAARLDPDNMDG